MLYGAQGEGQVENIHENYELGARLRDIGPKGCQRRIAASAVRGHESTGRQ